MTKLRPRSVYDVMAAIAFFAGVAGGTAYAAATIGSNDIQNDAVLSRHIKDGAVANNDLGADAVGTGKVINGSLLPVDLTPGARTRKVEFSRLRSDETKREVLSLGNLQLSAECDPTPQATLFVYAKNISSETGQLNAGYVRWSEHADTAPVTDGYALGTGSEMTIDDEDHFPPAERNIVGATSAQPREKAEGNIVMHTPGRVTTVTFHAFVFYNAGKPSKSFCELYGTAATATT